MVTVVLFNPGRCLCVSPRTLLRHTSTAGSFRRTVALPSSTKRVKNRSTLSCTCRGTAGAEQGREGRGGNPRGFQPSASPGSELRPGPAPCTPSGIRRPAPGRAGGRGRAALWCRGRAPAARRWAAAGSPPPHRTAAASPTAPPLPSPSFPALPALPEGREGKARGGAARAAAPGANATWRLGGAGITEPQNRRSIESYPILIRVKRPSEIPTSPHCVPQCHIPAVLEHLHGR